MVHSELDLRSLVELGEVYQISRARGLLAQRCRECVEKMVVLCRIGSEFYSDVKMLRLGAFSIVVRGVVTLNFWVQTCYLGYLVSSELVRVCHQACRDSVENLLVT